MNYFMLKHVDLGVRPLEVGVIGLRLGTEFTEQRGEILLQLVVLLTAPQLNPKPD